MLALVTSTENSRGNILKLYILNNSIWLKDTQLDTKKPLSSISFSPEGKAIAVTSNDQVSVLSLDLDEVLERGCNQVRDYLKNNPKAEKSDRHLCDDILPKK
jgi:WD40 repeat protein